MCMYIYIYIYRERVLLFYGTSITIGGGRGIVIREMLSGTPCKQGGREGRNRGSEIFKLRF